MPKGSHLPPKNRASSVGKLALILLVWITLSWVSRAEETARNVFLVTTDGLRWQEVFTGAERALIDAEVGRVKDTNAILRAYWRDSDSERRQALFPFLWSVVAKQGQIWGNRKLDSVVRVSNGHNFSYPGYSEFLTGIVDARIDSNDPKPNPNVNVFQWLQTAPGFRGRTFAAVSWGVIPWILNSDKAGFPVWSAFPVPAGTHRMKVGDRFQELLDRATPIWADVSLDTFCTSAAKEAVRTLKPRAGYVALGETDDWAHDGRYDLYLRSARNFDRFIEEFWTLLQSMPRYRGTTALVITTDHGRGSGPVAWKNHGRALAESSANWIAMIGTGIPSAGERSNTSATSSQVAATVAQLVGKNFVKEFPAAASPLDLSTAPR